MALSARQQRKAGEYLEWVPKLIGPEYNAEELLLRTLTPKQREQWMLKGSFWVRAERRHVFRRTYKVRRKYPHLLRFRFGFLPLGGYCVHFLDRPQLPNADLVLAIKLALEGGAEKKLRKDANWWPLPLLYFFGDLT